MKAISLWQPWASLVALGVKTIETRSWSTKYRGPLTIHAAARRPEMMYLPPQPLGRDLTGWHPWFVCDTITDPRYQGPQPQGRRIPQRATTPTLFFPHDGTYPLSEEGYAPTLHLPLGAVVATCTLVDCAPMLDVKTGEPERLLGISPAIYVEPDGLTLSHHFEVPARHIDISGQRPFGDFRPGRWGWILEDIKAVDPPVPARGRQQLWNWEQ